MIHVTMTEVAINPAVLKTREGLQWLISYNREALNDGCEQLANKTDVMDLMFDICCQVTFPFSYYAPVVNNEWYTLLELHFNDLPF